MQLHATRPFFAPPDLEPVVRLVCTALGIVRFARESAVLAYAGPMGLTQDALDAWIASGILGRGAVRFDPISTTSASFLALSSKGARMLAELTGVAVKGVGPAAMKHGSQKRAHDVEVGDFCLALLALSFHDQVKMLGIETDPKKVPVCMGATSNKRGHDRFALQPDAYVLAEGAHGPTALLVEVDRGTVSLARMTDKYRGYLAWKESGGPERDLALRAVRVLTVAPSERRALALHTTALTASLGRRTGFLLFATSEAVLADPEALLGPSVRPLGSPPGMLVPLFDPSPLPTHEAPDATRPPTSHQPSPASG